MSPEVGAAAGRALFTPIPEATSAVLPTVVTILQKTYLIATPTAGSNLEIRQILPECQPAVQSISGNLQQSLATLSQSLQAATISAANNLAQAQASAAGALASASKSANVAISAVQSSASNSANGAIASVQSSASNSAVVAIAAVQSSASVSADAVISSVQSSASIAMASVAASVSASVAVAMASISLDRNSAASQVAQANQQASDSKLAALNATQTAFAVLGTIVGSSLISILIYWLISRQRKRNRRRNKRDKKISKPMSIDAEEKKIEDLTPPSTAMSQDSQGYPKEGNNAMAMASSVPMPWDRQYPQLGGPTDARQVSYFQPISGVSPLPNFSNNNASRAPSLKRGTVLPLARQNATGNSRMSEMSNKSRESEVSEWSFVPVALGYQAAIDEGKEIKTRREKEGGVRSRRNSLHRVDGDKPEDGEARMLLSAVSYVDLKSQAGNMKPKGTGKEKVDRRVGDDDDSESRSSRKSSIGTAM